MEKHVDKKKLISIWILLSVGFVSVAIIGVLLFDWFLILWMPLSFLLAIGFQAMSHHFMEEQLVCPQCQHLNNLDAITCARCGFAFWRKCPNCGIEVPYNSSACDNCGTVLLKE